MTINATPYGGKGGDADDPRGAASGAGNPAGGGTTYPTSIAEDGTGGLLIVICQGDIDDGWTFESKGSPGGYVTTYTVNGQAGGGASGGGPVAVLCAGTIGAGVTVDTSGGPGGTTISPGGTVGGDGGQGAQFIHNISV